MSQAKFYCLLLILYSLCMNYVFAIPTMNADKAASVYLEQFRLDYIKSIVESNVSKLEIYYGENVRLMPEFQKTIIGKNNALDYHTAFSERFNVHKYTRNQVEVVDLGSKLLELGMFTIEMDLKSTGKEYSLKGKYFNVWEKTANGKLALITEAWNYNHHTEITEQLRFEKVPALQIAYQAHLPVNSNISFELAALNGLMERAFTQHDAKLMAQFYSDDAMFIYSYNPVYKGRKELDTFFEAHMKEMPIFEKLDNRTDQIDLLGEYVIEYGSHIANWRHGDSSGISTGKSLRIWRRAEDGSLKIFRQMAMYD